MEIFDNILNNSKNKRIYDERERLKYITFLP